MSTVESVVNQWIDAINTQNVALLKSLAADNHVFFVDGEVPTVGNQHIEKSWNGYFSAYPTYQIFIDKTIYKEDATYLLGHTSGSHVPPEIEEIPNCVLWRCEVKDAHIKEWSIYPVSKIILSKFGLV